MSSNSNDDGSYFLNVFFEVGTDGDMDFVKVQNNVASANSSLPETVIASGVTTSKSSQDMSMIFAFYCDNGLYDTAFIKNYTDIYIVGRTGYFYFPAKFSRNRYTFIGGSRLIIGNFRGFYGFRLHN